MSAVLYSNNASTSLAAAVTNSATSLTVVSGTGALFPSITNSDYFYVTIENASGSREIVKATARAADSLTITRAQDGTAALSWNAGDRVDLRITKAMLDDLKSGPFKAYSEIQYAAGTIGSTWSPAIANGNIQYAILTSATNCTVTVPTLSTGQSLTLTIKQPASGTAATVIFSGQTFANMATSIAASTTLGKLTTWTIYNTGSEYQIFCVVGA